MSSTPTRFVLIAIALLLVLDVALRLQPAQQPAWAPTSVDCVTPDLPARSCASTDRRFDASAAGRNCSATLVNSSPTFQAPR